MKKFCESLKEHAIKITNSKKNKIKLLTRIEGIICKCKILLSDFVFSLFCNIYIYIYCFLPNLSQLTDLIFLSKSKKTKRNAYLNNGNKE